MSLNLIDTHKAHREYRESNPIFQRVVDSAYKAVSEQIQSAGLLCANDDTAEELVAAIAHYVRKSNPIPTGE